MTSDEQRLRLITTEDGSHSLYVPDLNETYHSFHGALQESDHVFIKTGLDHFARNHPQDMINVLEIGLGTGLNALLTAYWSHERKRPVRMTSVEAFPVSWQLASQLNYPEKIPSPDAAEWFGEIHNSPWEKDNSIHKLFSLKKVRARLQDHKLPANEYNVVFFDAFAPSKQSELWEPEILQKVFSSQVDDSVFVTYCAKGQLKRDLKAIGYDIETLPGPPGKKEMVRGTKPDDN